MLDVTPETLVKQALERLTSTYPLGNPLRIKRKQTQEPISESETEDTHFQTANEDELARALDSSVLEGEEVILDLTTVSRNNLNADNIDSNDTSFLNKFLSNPTPPLEMAPQSNTGSESGSTRKTAGMPKAMPAAWTGKHPMFDLNDLSMATRFFEGVDMAAHNAGCPITMRR